MWREKGTRIRSQGCQLGDEGCSCSGVAQPLQPGAPSVPPDAAHSPNSEFSIHNLRISIQTFEPFLPLEPMRYFNQLHLFFLHSCSPHQPGAARSEGGCGAVQGALDGLHGWRESRRVRVVRNGVARRLGGGGSVQICHGVAREMLSVRGWWAAWGVRRRGCMGHSAALWGKRVCHECSLLFLAQRRLSLRPHVDLVAAHERAGWCAWCWLSPAPGWV